MHLYEHVVLITAEEVIETSNLLEHLIIESWCLSNTLCRYHFVFIYYFISLRIRLGRRPLVSLLHGTVVSSHQAHFSTGLDCGSFSACAQFSIASSRFNLVGINWNLGPTGFCSLNKILACVLCCACFLVFLFDCACLHL